MGRNRRRRNRPAFFDEIMKFKVGELYERPCAIIQMDDGRTYAIPIIEHLHADPQFGFPHPHYHIDARFYMEPRMAHHYRLQKGETAFVIQTEGSMPKFIRVERRAVACVGQLTGLAIPCSPKEQQTEKLALYNKWYEAYLGRHCEGKRCPHLGTEMLGVNGELVCPLHKLTADLDTLVIKPRSKEQGLIV